MGVGVFNPQLDQPLSRKLRVSSVPAVVAVRDGKVQWFKNHFTHANLREFIRSLYPSDLIVEVGGFSPVVLCVFYNCSFFLMYGLLSSYHCSVSFLIL